MQTNTAAYNAASLMLRRSVKTNVRVFTGSSGTTLKYEFQGNKVSNIEIQRAGEDSKFFGFGVFHKLNLKLFDPDRTLTILPGEKIQVQLGLVVGDSIEYKDFPYFYVKEVKRDENNNSLSVVAHDILDSMSEHTIEEINIAAPYTLEQFTNALATFVDGVQRTSSGEAEEVNIIPSLVYSGSSSYGITDIIEYDDYVQAFYIDGTVTTSSLAYSYYRVKAQDTTAKLGAGTYKMQLKVTGNYTGKIEFIPFSGKNIVVTNQDVCYFTLDAAASFNSMDLRLYDGASFDNVVVTIWLSQVAEEEADTKVYHSLINPSYETGANFEGNETVRAALTAVAEATQTIYYMGADNLIHFKRLSDTNALDKTITKAIYSTLKSGDSHLLQTIVSSTELGENVSASASEAGETQYVRDNPFWDLREDIASIVDNAVAEAGNIAAIHAFECEWRGDPSLEIGDRIAFITKDDKVIYSYFLNDTLTFNGGLKQKTEWVYKTNGEQSHSNPTSLGEVIKHTYAKVDKANKEISLVAGESSANAQEIAALKINTESISASVSKVEEANSGAISSLNGEIATLTKKVEATMTSEDVKLEIKSELSNGVDKVTTATGFTFNEEGLTIAKTGSEMTTNIDEDGMSVYRDDEEVLTADNTGVTAYNLHARTYLIVGENSRFEDFTSTSGEARTGCFWIGG